MSSIIFFRRNQNLGEEITLSQEEVEHLRSLRILKEKKSFQVELRNGIGLRVKYLFEPGNLKGREIQREAVPLKGFDLTVLMAIPKPGKLEFWLQKGTELGITNFHFAMFRYSERKELNKERCFKIIQEACSQSQRDSIPNINIFNNLESAFSSNENTKYIYLHPYTNASLDFSNQDISTIIPIIGPEAGFHESEINFFQEKNIGGFSLGENILRMETAAVTITSIIQYERNKQNGSNR